MTTGISQAALYALYRITPQPAMQYCGQDNLIDYLNFSSSSDAPIKAVTCPFVQGGVGIPPVVVGLLVFGGVGLAMAVRVRHPGPLLVAFMLTGGVAAASAPGQALNLLAIAIFVGISALGLYLYQRAQNSL